MALVLHADHELNTSAFTAHCTASTAANPYSAVAAALCATMGGQHADFTGARALIEAHGRGDVTGVAELTDFPGFAHKLYPAGDPRAICLLAVMRDIPEMSATVADIDKLVAAIEIAHSLIVSSGSSHILFHTAIDWTTHPSPGRGRGRCRFRPRHTTLPSRSTAQVSPTPNTLSPSCAFACDVMW